MAFQKEKHNRENNYKNDFFLETWFRNMSIKHEFGNMPLKIISKKMILETWFRKYDLEICL